MNGIDEIEQFISLKGRFVTVNEVLDRLNNIISSHHVKYGDIEDYRKLLALRSGINSYLEGN